MSNLASKRRKYLSKGQKNFVKAFDEESGHSSQRKVIQFSCSNVQIAPSRHLNIPIISGSFNPIYRNLIVLFY